MHEPCKLCHAGHPVPESRFYCWLAANDRRYQKAWGLPETAPETRPEIPGELISGAGRRRAAIAREVVCIHLGMRVEMRTGCNGWQCQHGCALDLPAVPGGYCQACEGYVGDYNEDGVTGPAWIG